MLPFVSLLLFAILGIAALCVDMGLAFGIKARLASAAETLALERSRLSASSGEPSAQEAELRSLLESLIGTSPPAAAGGISPLPVEGPVLGDEGEVALSQRMPLLFGMAAVPNRDAEALSVGEIREARESGTGLLENGGLRGHGLAPGARARALSRPVLRVGLPQPGAPGGPMPGLADVALELGALQNPPAGTPILGSLLYVDAASGELRSNDSDGPRVGWVIPHPVNEPCLSEPCPGWRGWRVGDSLSSQTDALPRVPGLAYVPVFDADRCDRVMGYLGATLSISTDEGATRLELRPFDPGPVPANASAVPHAFDPAAGGVECELQVADVRSLADSLPLPLLQVAGLGRAVEAP